jgi:hypothetical protein
MSKSRTVDRVWGLWVPELLDAIGFESQDSVLRLVLLLRSFVGRVEVTQNIGVLLCAIVGF